MMEGGKNNKHNPSVNFSTLKTIYYWEFSVLGKGTLNNQQRNIEKGSTLYKSCSPFHNLIEQDFFIYFEFLKIIRL